MSRPRIFISYPSQDRPRAEAIHRYLEEAGYDVWRDKTHLETDWSEEIAKALAERDLLCLLWSEHAAASKWVKHEWLTARALEKLIIPCLFPQTPKLEPPELPEPLHNLHGVSFNSMEEGCSALGKRIGGLESFSWSYEYNLLPGNSQIPHNPNPKFTGRLDDLLELYLKMIGNLRKIGINHVGAVGMGGIGKTQLAVEFAYRFSFAFDAVYWLNAADPITWHDKFISLARNQLELEIKDADEPAGATQYLFALRKHFNEHPNTLLVMDNVTEPKDLNSETRLGFAPLNLRCDLLFTTRRHFELVGVSSKPVDVLSKEAAYALLASYREPKPAERVHAEAICNAVGRLPLAIVLIGAHLKRYKTISFAGYYNELVPKKLESIDIGKLSEEELATRHLASVKATLDDHWRTLKDEDARSLFRLAGQFPEAAIIPKARLGLLAEIAAARSEIDLPLETAFENLHDLCLVERLKKDTKAVRLHPLVREFSNQLVTGEKKTEFRADAARRLRDALFVYADIERAVRSRGVVEVVADLETGVEWLGNEGDGSEELKLLQGALRLASHLLGQDPGQLAAQLLGRLLEAKNRKIRSLLDQAGRSQQRPWLRPLNAGLIKPGGALVHTLVHETEVTALAIMHDEEHAIVGEADGTLTRWDWKRGTPIGKWKKHDSKVLDLGVSPDGCFLVALFADSWLKVFSPPDGMAVLSVRLDGMLPLDNLHQNRAAMSNDGRTIAIVAGGEDEKELVLLRLAENYEACQEIFRLVEPHIRALALSAGGKKLFWLVRENSRSTLKMLNVGEGIWDARFMPREVDFGHWQQNHEILAVSPDGALVVLSGLEPPFVVWDFSGEMSRKELEATGGHWLLAVAPGGKRGISTEKGGELTLWDLEKSSKLASLGSPEHLFPSVLITGDGLRALSAGGNIVKVWNLELEGEQLDAAGDSPARAIWSLGLSTDCQSVASGSWNGEIVIWHVPSAKPQSPPLSAGYGPIRKTIFLPDEKRLLVFQDQGLVYFDLENMTCGEPIGLEGNWPLAVTADGRTALVGGSEHIEIRDLITDETLYTEKADIRMPCRAPVTAISLEGRAVFCTEDGALRTFDMVQRKSLPSIDVEGGGVSAVEVTPDGKQAVLGFHDGLIRVYDPEHHTCISLANKHAKEVRSVAVVPNGRLLVSCAADGTLVVWDLLTKEAIDTFSGDSAFDSCAITADGRIIIAGESSGRLHFLKGENITVKP